MRLRSYFSSWALPRSGARCGKGNRSQAECSWSTPSENSPHLYALADVAFVGGSLVPRGGHNLIEPAQHGVAIITGNYTENFRDIVALFQSRDAVRIVSPAELPLTLMQLLADDAERRALGRSALETMRSQRGATSRTLEALQTLIISDSDARAVSANAAHSD